MTDMQVHTLGELYLTNSSFKRTKPLLLITYLALEGPKPRRYVAEIFWPSAQDPMNSLSVALSQVRRGAPGIIETDETRVWSTLATDTNIFLNHLKNGRIEQALECYQGHFLESLDLGLGIELEDWLYQKREFFATQLRFGLIEYAEKMAAIGDFKSSTLFAEAAYARAGGDAELEDLRRLYALLVAGSSPYASEVRKEAEAFGTQLALATNEARNRLQPTFIGRLRERQQLQELAKGEWVWVRGGAGMGKTSLLRMLNGRHLPARKGLPYATLEPLLSSVLNSKADADTDEEMILRGLSTHEGLWLCDDWEKMDKQSRLLLERLNALQPSGLQVIITSKDPPAIRVHHVFDLQPLTEEELKEHDHLWAETHGIPQLVGAFLRHESLEHALKVRLDTLSHNTQEVYLALALLLEPDLVLVRRALQLKAGHMSAIHETLVHAGLVTTSGQVCGQHLAMQILDEHPERAGPLALKLARQLDLINAFPLYQRSQLVWTEEDSQRIETAYIEWAQEHMLRGFPQEAANTLDDAPQSEAITFLKARALEQAGEYDKALKILQKHPDSPETLALKGTLLWRCGYQDEARSALEEALHGDVQTRAHALNALGNIHRDQGDYEASSRHYRRCSTLWLALSHQEKYVDCLNNLAINATLLGDDAEEIFTQALDAAQDYPLHITKTLINMGWMYEHCGTPAEAEKIYIKAIDSSYNQNDLALAYNNLGALYHRQEDHDKARHMYVNALEVAQALGSRYTIGMVLANLAELNSDRDSWEEALALLEASGHAQEAQRYRDDLPDNHPFRTPLR